MSLIHVSKSGVATPVDDDDDDDDAAADWWCHVLPIRRSLLCIYCSVSVSVCARVCVCCGMFFLLLFFALVTRLIRGEEKGNRRHHSNDAFFACLPHGHVCMDLCVCVCVWKQTKQEARVAFIMLRRIINSAPPPPPIGERK